jgi:hypothetical protein
MRADDGAHPSPHGAAAPPLATGSERAMLPTGHRSARPFISRSGPDMSGGGRSLGRRHRGRTGTGEPGDWCNRTIADEAGSSHRRSLLASG